MKIIAFFIFIFITTTCYCQTIDADTLILKARIDSMRFQGQIIYTDKIVGWERLQDAFKGTTLRSYKDKKQFLKLTKKEWNYLHEELQMNKGLVWKDGMFANSIMIDADSMWTVLSKKRKEYFAKCQELSLKKDTLLLSKMYLRMPQIFSFSKPIYFQNNTVCLVFYQWTCGGDCGEFETFVLKKSNGLWKFWFVAHGGIY